MTLIAEYNEQSTYVNVDITKKFLIFSCKIYFLTLSQHVDKTFIDGLLTYYIRHTDMCIICMSHDTGKTGSKCSCHVV